jgi:hypothetical protein
MSRLVLAVVAVVAVTAGCSHGTKQLNPKPRPKSLTACEHARAKALREPRRNVLRGYVEGSGYGDAVTLVKVRTAPRRCGAFLIVRGRRRTMTWPLHRNAVSGLPRLNGLASLRPGRLHIVVTTGERGSVDSARLFAIRNWRISPVMTPSVSARNGIRVYSGGGESAVLAYGGSAGHLYGVDCGSGGAPIVASGYFLEPAGLPFGFVRRAYWLDDRDQRDRLGHIFTKRGTTKRHREFEEFREPQPFPSCMRVRAE